MRIALITTALLLAGCASLDQIILELSKDPASACIGVNAPMYGQLIVGRTNPNPGMSSVTVTPDGCQIQHMGGGKPAPTQEASK